MREQEKEINDRNNERFREEEKLNLERTDESLAREGLYFLEVAREEENGGEVVYAEKVGSGSGSYGEGYEFYEV